MNMISAEQHLVNKWRNLPPTQQQQVLNFIELLESESSEETSASEVIPTIEIWSPFDSFATAQDLQKLFEDNPGEALA